jgi:hypothetical protein
VFNNCRVAKYMWLNLRSLFPSHFATRAMSMVTMLCHIKVNWKNIKFFIKVQYKTMFSCNRNLQLCSSSTLLQYPFSGCRIYQDRQWKSPLNAYAVTWSFSLIIWRELIWFSASDGVIFVTSTMIRREYFPPRFQNSLKICGW